MNVLRSTPACSRREFLSSAVVLIGAGRCLAGSRRPKVAPTPADPEPIIDIHQHTSYSGRTDAQLLAHQRAMGVTLTILLPAGSLYGLAAGCGGNETCVALARQYPEEFVFFSNEVADLPQAPDEVRKFLRQGAVGVGEQKFNLPCDSPHLERLAEVAHEFRVPMLLHFQHGAYNTGFENFHKVLEKFPKVNFIGHAQTWWANIDRNHGDQSVLYPVGKVTPGGLTDRLLSDYPNMYGDLSAGSGLNALLRDEDHTREFFQRHQDKLLYGSDCNDAFGCGYECQGSQTIAAIKHLAPTKQIERKLLFENAKKMFGF